MLSQGRGLDASRVREGRESYEIIRWIIEAMTLRYTGIPLASYSLHLGALLNTLQHIWNWIRSMAVFLQAAL
jgi:hypothetical protein